MGPLYVNSHIKYGFEIFTTLLSVIQGVIQLYREPRNNRSRFSVREKTPPPFIKKKNPFCNQLFHISKFHCIVLPFLSPSLRCCEWTCCICIWHACDCFSKNIFWKIISKKNFRCIISSALKWKSSKSSLVYTKHNISRYTNSHTNSNKSLFHNDNTL